MSWRTARGTTFGLLILYPYLPLCHSVYSQSFPRKMAFMENKQINKSFCEIGFWFPVSCSFPSLLTVTHLATVKHMLQKRLGSCGQNFPPFNLNPRSSQGHFSWPHSPWIRVESVGCQSHLEAVWVPADAFLLGTGHAPSFPFLWPPVCRGSPWCPFESLSSQRWPPKHTFWNDFFSQPPAVVLKLACVPSPSLWS